MAEGASKTIEKVEMATTDLGTLGKLASIAEEMGDREAAKYFENRQASCIDSSAQQAVEDARVKLRHALEDAGIDLDSPYAEPHWISRKYDAAWPEEGDPMLDVVLAAEDYIEAEETDDNTNDKIIEGKTPTLGLSKKMRDTLAELGASIEEDDEGNKTISLPE